MITTPIAEERVAHYRKSGETQRLERHLLETSFLASTFARKVNLSLAGELVGLLHDLGKYSDEFQQYLRSSVGIEEQDGDNQHIGFRKAKGKVDHSSAGAQRLWRGLRDGSPTDRVVGEILALCIASHHSGLIDCVDASGADLLSRRIAKPEELSHGEEAWAKADASVRQRYNELITSDRLKTEVRDLISDLGRTDQSKTARYFKLGLLVRFLLSCLLDADRINTADFDRPWLGESRLKGQYESWQVLLDRLELHLSRFVDDTQIDQLRRDVSAHCLAASERKPGIFTLTVPTGGGKTLASLRFALHHAARHQMERVIYVIPYTSIIDQNAEQVRQILEPETCEVATGSIVLEHHSNLLPERHSWRNKLLTENWDAPVVFTTMVQLLDALFGGGTRGARRMHQLAKSIVIFDEIQTLPIKCVHLFNNAMNFLVDHCGSTVLLCTATQPILHEVNERKGAIRLSQQSELMPDVSALFQTLSRVQVLDRRKPGVWTNAEVAQLAVKETSSSRTCLVVVNTKSAAQALYFLCRDQLPPKSIFHLSTNMCAAHRKECLRKIKELIAPECGSQVLCISTQLIEAGVDLDFGSAIRFVAGLDSIAQASGRCNRHGHRALGKVHIVNPEEDKSEMISDIRIGRQAAMRVLDEIAGDGGINPLSPEVMYQYFHYYFFERRHQMDYPVTTQEHERSDTLLNMLSENKAAVSSATQPITNYLRQSFKTAAELFKSIDSPTEGVIVPYGDGASIVARLAIESEPEEQLRLLRQAQQFTVNVFPQIMRRLQAQDALREAPEGTGILCLDERYYHPEFGLTESPIDNTEVRHFKDTQYH
jgi:CRISPR-associated endonuclease/helicase Cas3